MKKKTFAILMAVILFISISSNLSVYALDKVIIEDNNLKSVILSTLGKNEDYELNKSDMETITSLSAEGRNIESLKGLEYCSNLTYLDLKDNNILNVQALSSLKKLVKLDLDENKVKDISPLSSLTNLVYTIS